jgi:hypothetical protein
MWKYLLLQAYIFWALKKKFKKNNFFFEFGGPKPLMSVCLSETHFFCCRHGIRPIFGVFIQNLILRTMQVTKNYSDYYLAEIGSWKWKKKEVPSNTIVDFKPDLHWSQQWRFKVATVCLIWRRLLTLGIGCFWAEFWVFLGFFENSEFWFLWFFKILFSLLLLLFNY